MRATSHSTAPRSLPDGLYCETRPINVSKSASKSVYLFPASAHSFRRKQSVSLFSLRLDRKIKRQHFFQCGNDLIQLLIGDNQWRQETDGGQACVQSNNVAFLQCSQIGSYFLFQFDT